MKLTESLIKQFENDQLQYGTEAAIYNLFWAQAAELFKDLGITDIKTRIKHLKVA